MSDNFEESSSNLAEGINKVKSPKKVSVGQKKNKGKNTNNEDSGEDLMKGHKKNNQFF